MANWLPLASEVTTIFTQFGLSPEIIRSVHDAGYVKPTPVQKEVIPLALGGGDLIATAETGSGKTAAFLLPVIERLRKGKRGRTRALILSPTREIASQTCEQSIALTQGTTLRTVSVYGGLGMERQKKALKAGAEIVVATPGRLLDHYRRGNARLDSVEVLVVDEADRMMDMGFIPDLRRILSLLPKERQSMLFSATMPIALMELAYEKILRRPDFVEIGSQSVPPATISQAVYRVPSRSKTKLLLHLLDRGGMESVMVFVRTKRQADSLARNLQRTKMKVECLHGDRSQKERERALERFRTKAARVLVATDVAARGLDVEGVTHVVNYNAPDMPAVYLNRIGRTARAGASGEAITLVSREDEPTLSDIERTLGMKIPRRSVTGLTEPERKPGADASAKPRSRLFPRGRLAGARRRR